MPDLEAIITRDLARSLGIDLVICSGWVESKIVIFLLLVLAISSVANEEPPMPQRTNWSNLLLRVQADRASSSGSNCREVTGRSTQPSRLGASLVGPQIEESFAAILGSILFNLEIKSE